MLVAQEVVQATSVLVYRPRDSNQTQPESYGHCYSSHFVVTGSWIVATIKLKRCTDGQGVVCRVSDQATAPGTAAAHRRLNTPPSQMLSSGPNTVALHTNRFSSLVGLALHLQVHERPLTHRKPHKDVHSSRALARTGPE